MKFIAGTSQILIEFSKKKLFLVFIWIYKSNVQNPPRNWRTAKFLREKKKKNTYGRSLSSTLNQKMTAKAAAEKKYFLFHPGTFEKTWPAYVINFYFSKSYPELERGGNLSWKSSKRRNLVSPQSINGKLADELMGSFMCFFFACLFSAMSQHCFCKNKTKKAFI